MDQLMALVKTGSAGHTPATSFRTRWRDVLVAAVTRVERWRDRVRQRHLLAQLSERELRDVGLTRYDALQEWRKPFWQE